MKHVFLLATLQTMAVSGAVVWTANFDGVPLESDNLEAQDPAWLTDPEGTDSIAVFDNKGFNLPSSYGNKSLAVGGVAPQNETIPGEVSVVSPLAFKFVPTPGGAETEAVFSVDMIFSATSTVTDSFRFSFFDTAGDVLGNLLFTPGKKGLEVAIYRNNLASTFDTQFTLTNNTAVKLDLVMNFEFGKWSGAITPDGTQNAVSLFANVDMTDPNVDPQPQKELGGFQVAWLKNDDNWGDNYLVLDNFSLSSQVPIPEPSSALLICGFSMMALFRRNRQA